MDLPDFYLKRFLAGAELHVHLSGPLKGMAERLHTIADRLQEQLDSHTVEELIDPKTTPLKFSRPIEFDDGEGRIRLIETYKTGLDVAISGLYKELTETEDETLSQEKIELLRKLQQLEADRWSRNVKRRDTFDSESWKKLHEETKALLEKYGVAEAGSTFKRLDRVVCKEHQGVGLGMGDKGVVLENVDPKDLMQHEDPNEPKVSVVWDAKELTDPKDGEKYLDCISSTHTSPKALELADPSPEDPIFFLQALVYDEFNPETEISEGQDGKWFLKISNYERGDWTTITVEYHPDTNFCFSEEGFIHCDLTLGEAFNILSKKLPDVEDV